MKQLSRLEQIYQAGLERIEKAPDYHYSDSKPKKAPAKFHDRGVESVQVAAKAKKQYSV